MIGLGLACAGMASAAAPDTPATPAPAKSTAAPELHTFTDAKGQTLKAQVLSMAGTTVNLRREDGQTVQAPLASLTPHDRTYIIEELLKPYAARNQAVLALSAVTEKSAVAVAKIDGGTQSTWKENFRITVKNETLLTLDNLRARIIVFKVLQLPDVPGGAPSNIQLLAQLQDLPAVPASGNVTLPMDGVPMTQFTATNGGQFANEAVHAQTDKLLAVWLRIYDSNDYVVQEWCSMPTLMKQQTWDSAWTQAAGLPKAGARGARGGRQ